jgi:site-specific DNA-cytosine methylase
MTLKVLDLFSGIGGFSLGLERTGGFETVAFCEIEDIPRNDRARDTKITTMKKARITPGLFHL